MSTINIEIEDSLGDALAGIAAERRMGVNDLIIEALNAFLTAQRAQTARYSFIGIGDSGKESISIQVDEILAQNASRREGWSL